MKAEAEVTSVSDLRFCYRTRSGLRSVWLGLDFECGASLAVQVNGKSICHQRKPKQVHKLPSVTK